MGRLRKRHRVVGVPAAVDRALLTLAVYAVTFLLFLLIVVNAGFVVNAVITEWTLPAAFIVYASAALAWHLPRVQKTVMQKIFIAGAAFMLPVLFFIGGTQLFGHTHDASWDGQNYHATGIIGLSRGWNPLYQNNVPFQPANNEGGTIGSPKALWEIQAAIYKVAKPIESAFIVNVYIALTAAIFAYAALRSLGIRTCWAVPLTILCVVAPQLPQQLFSFMGDGFSYELSVIAASSLILFTRRVLPRTMLAVFIIAVILMAGVKLSNAYVTMPLLCAFAYALYKQKHTQRWLRWTIAVAAGIAVLVLWAPYATNMLRHGSPIYPFNEPAHRGSMTYNGVPDNIKGSNHLQLLYYGLFSKTVGGNARDHKNNAVLKIPFTVHASELEALERDREHLVGGEGVLFSGILLIATFCFILTLWWEKSPKDRSVVGYIILAVSVVLVGILMNPIPNYVRYTPQMWWLPLIIIVGLLLLNDFKTRRIRILFAGSLLALSLVNMLISVTFTLQGRLRENTEITQQIHHLKQSDATYQVRTNYFYSHLVRLRERGISIERVEQLTCKQPQKLIYSWDTTTFCAKR